MQLCCSIEVKYYDCFLEIFSTHLYIIRIIIINRTSIDVLKFRKITLLTLVDVWSVKFNFCVEDVLFQTSVRHTELENLHVHILTSA